MPVQIKDLEEKYQSFITALPHDIAESNNKAISENITAIIQEINSVLEALDRQELFE